MGCLLAFLLHHPGAFDRLRWLGRPSVQALTLMAVLVLHIATNWLPVGQLFIIAVTAFVGGVVMSPASKVARVLANQSLVAVGTLSYGIYLFHQLALNVAERVIPARFGLGGDLVTVVLGTFIVIVSCGLLHRYFEKPLIEVGRKLAKGSRQVARG